MLWGRRVVRWALDRFVHNVRDSRTITSAVLKRQEFKLDPCASLRSSTMHWESLQQGPFIAASALVFAALVVALAPRAGLERADAFSLFGLSGVFGVFFARVFWWCAQWLTASPPEFSSLYSMTGGFASVGALMGCALAWGLMFGGASTERRYAVLDLFVPAGLVALAVARLGCLARGCDFGVPAGGPLAVTYSQPATPAVSELLMRGELAPGQQVSLAPLALYLSCVSIAAVAIAILVSSRWRKPGRCAMLAALLYVVGRAFVESFRHPASAPMLGEMNLNQWVMMFLSFSIMLTWFVWERKRA